MADVLRLRELFVHPVKGCAGVAVRSMAVEPDGPRFDRRWMLVDGSGRFLSQREHPALALVRPEPAPEARSIRLRAPASRDLPAIAIPERPEGGPAVAVRIWDDALQALEHPEGSDWFARFLGLPRGSVRLVGLAPGAHRVLPPGEAAEGRVGLADGFPYLLATERSLAELERRAGRRFGMRRFRPNLVLDGAEPFEEEGWGELRIGAVAFRCVRPCPRCVVTTVDPARGERDGPEPLRTLASFRRRDGKVWFGVNLVPLGEGTVRVGDDALPCPAAPAY